MYDDRGNILYEEEYYQEKEENKLNNLVWIFFNTLYILIKKKAVLLYN